METRHYLSNQNGDSKLHTFIPEFKITRLTKVKESLIPNQPSLSSSPQTLRSDLLKKPDVPEFLTLGRRNFSKKLSDNDLSAFSKTEANSERHLDAEELEKIRSILSGLDLAKYKRRPRLNSDNIFDYGRHQPLRRCHSDHPQVTSDGNSIKKSLLDSIPPPPKAMLARSSPGGLELVPLSTNFESLKIYSLDSIAKPPKFVNHKLKELTEKLRPASAPPSPHRKLKSLLPYTAPPTSAFTFWKEPLTFSKLVANYDEPCKNVTLNLSSVPKRKILNNSTYATLPRTKNINHREPRTIACLDLNTCLGPVAPKKTFDTRQALEDLKKSLSRESHCKNDETDDTSLDETSKIEMKNAKANKRNNFDSNFVKFRSLNYPEDKIAEKRCAENEHSLQKLSSSRVKNEDSYPCNGEVESIAEKDNDHKQSIDVGGSESETETSRVSKSLEAEIRTIAKLLDGKESLFLKLIESSKSRPTDGSNHKDERPLSPEAPLSAPIVSQHQESASNTDSSSRMRAMTVPGSDSNRVPATATYKSPPPQQKRYSKKRLRGPYGEMLEQEMSKSMNKPRPSYANDLDFLRELSNSKPKTSEKPRPLLRSSSQSLEDAHSIAVDGTPKRKTSANLPLVDSQSNQDSLRVPSTPVGEAVSEPTLHIRSHSDSVKTSSSWNVDSLINRTLKFSSHQDTRTHIVGELYETEMSYVESLQILVKKYMHPLKNSDHVESSQVDEIFCQVPAILELHEAFLETLKQRLVCWDTKQKIGDVFIDVFTKSSVVDTYMAFINNWKSARDMIKAISQAKPAFAKFLEHTSREHKGKLTIDALLIMPVQRIPRYELLIKELLKHTPLDHPDYKLLLQAQKEVHELAITINKVEREALQQEQMIQKVKELEQLIEGVADLAQNDRAFIRHDFVMIPGGLGIKKERCLFLFSDLLLITSIKRKGGAMRKTSLSTNTSYGSLESNKYKLLMQTSLHNVEIIKTDVDEPCVRKYLKEISTLEGDVVVLGKINEMLGTLNCPHQMLDEAVKDVLSSVSRQLVDKQASGSQMMSLELAININGEIENIIPTFPNPEQRMMWEAAFLDAKEKLDLCDMKPISPEFVYSLPLRKTRAGLQINCAASVIDSCQTGLPDVWICCSDGYFGQVCVLTFQNEPVVVSCTSISNARILCIAAVPGLNPSSFLMRRRSTLLPHLPGFKFEKFIKEDKELGKNKKFPLDSDSDEDDFIDAADDDASNVDDADHTLPTMWLGTEDGCIFVYNSTDTKLRKTKLKMQHSTCIYDIIYLENRVLVSLANGELLSYTRDISGVWNTSNPERIQVASTVAPITKVVLINGKLWCATLNSIAIIDSCSLEVEHTFHVSSDISRHVTTIIPSEAGVWVAIQNASVVQLYNTMTYCEVLEINIIAPVTKVLSACDEIIRQHKLACLRVSALCVQKDLLWIGTSAGVVLNLMIPQCTSTTNEADIMPNIIGMPQGHCGHVRFITTIYAPSGKDSSSLSGLGAHAKESPSKDSIVSDGSATSALVISGGDGCENFSSIADTEPSGRDDSTNHLLMWRV